MIIKGIKLLIEGGVLANIKAFKEATPGRAEPCLVVNVGTASAG